MIPRDYLDVRKLAVLNNFTADCATEGLVPLNEFFTDLHNERASTVKARRKFVRELKKLFSVSGMQNEVPEFALSRDVKSVPGWRWLQPHEIAHLTRVPLEIIEEMRN